MLPRPTPRQAQVAGIALVAIGCAGGFIQAFAPGTFGRAELFTLIFAAAFGAVLLVLANRCAEMRRALADPVRQLSELNQKLSVHAHDVATQADSLARQRDAFMIQARELTEQQHWMEMVLAQLPAGILLIDKDMNVVSRNDRFQELLGIPADAPPVKSLRDFEGWPAETLNGDPLPFDQWPLVRALRNGVPVFDQEMRVGIRGGGWFEAAVSARPIFDEKGATQGGVLLINDLTVRRENDERLRLLESAVVHANDAIIVLEAVSAEGLGRKVKYVNDGFTRLTGYGRDEVLGRSLHFLRGVDTDPQTLQNLRHALDTATPFRTELLNYRKDHSVVWVDLSLVPVQGADGSCSHYIMIQRDITARKIAEGSLRESEELFRGIFETTSAGVSIIDDTGRYVSCNPAFAAQVGRSVAEVLTLTPADVTHPDDWLAQQPLIQAVRERRSDRYQFAKRYVHPDGRMVCAELTFVAINDSDGNYQYGLAVSVDVTGRKQLEEQLRQAQKMEALGQLAGGIAHDFNNLLTAVLGNIALVKLPTGDPNRDLMRTIEQASGRAADLTRKLLGYARRNQLLVAPTQPRVLIAEVVDILRRTLDPRIEIVVKGSAQATVNVDATLINQALFNLCLNARDAMPDGGTLTLDAEDVTLAEEDKPHADAKPGHYVRLSVRDTGHGIADEIRDRLFEPFFTTKGVGKGTGLGLPMVHGIMRQHDGWVTVETSAGAGSCFALYLPASAELTYKPAPVNARLPALPIATPAPLVETPSPPRTGTILLVDDEDMIRNLGRAVLKSHGFEVLEAEDGCDAIEIFRREAGRIALVVLDMTMPRLSGLDAFRQMRAIDPDVRVLFSSGYSVEDVAEIEGSVGLLSKPYRPNELLVAVRRALRRTRETVSV